MLDFVFLLVVGIVYVPNGVFSGSHHETTLYVDTLLRVALPPEIQNSSLDPYSMPNFEVQSESDHSVTVKGKFLQGRMRGLSGLARIGQCGGPARTSQGNTTFTCTLGVDKLDLTYNTEIKYGVLPHSDSIVTANLTRPFGVIEVTSNARGNSPYLSRFTVASLGQFDSHITGGVLRSKFSYITTDFSHKVIIDVQNALNGVFKEALARAVSRSSLPSGLTQ